MVQQVEERTHWKSSGRMEGDMATVGDMDLVVVDMDMVVADGDMVVVILDHGSVLVEEMVADGPAEVSVEVADKPPTPHSPSIAGFPGASEEIEHFNIFPNTSYKSKTRPLHFSLSL